MITFITVVAAVIVGEIISTVFVLPLLRRFAPSHYLVTMKGIAREMVKEMSAPVEGADIKI